MTIRAYRSAASPRASSARKLAVTPQLQPINAVNSVSDNIIIEDYLRHSAQLRTPSLAWRRRGPVQEPGGVVDSEVEAGLAVAGEESIVNENVCVMPRDKTNEDKTCEVW
jgi:hypothetical protein